MTTGVIQVITLALRYNSSRQAGSEYQAHHQRSEMLVDAEARRRTALRSNYCADSREQTVKNSAPEHEGKQQHVTSRSQPLQSDLTHSSNKH